MGAFARQRPGAGEPDAARGAGDEGGAGLEGHGASSFLQVRVWNLLYRTAQEFGAASLVVLARQRNRVYIDAMSAMDPTTRRAARRAAMRPRARRPIDHGARPRPLRGSRRERGRAQSHARPPLDPRHALRGGKAAGRLRDDRPARGRAGPPAGAHFGLPRPRLPAWRTASCTGSRRATRSSPARTGTRGRTRRCSSSANRAGRWRKPRRPRWARASQALSSGLRFKPHAQVIEVAGLCAACADAKQA